MVRSDHSDPERLYGRMRRIAFTLYEHRARVFLWGVAFWFGWDCTTHGMLDSLLARLDAGPAQTAEIPEGIRRVMANDPKVGSSVGLLTLTTSDGRTVEFPPDAETEFVGLLFVQDCPSCGVESDIRVAEQLQQQAQGKLNVFIVMVGIDRDSAQAYWSGRGFTLPLLVDPTGAVAKRLNAVFLPRGYVIHRSGRLEYVTGYREPYDQVSLRLGQILAAGGPRQ